MGFQFKAAFASTIALLVVSAASFMAAQENDGPMPIAEENPTEAPAAVSVLLEPALDPVPEPVPAPEQHPAPDTEAAAPKTETALPAQAPQSAPAPQDDVDQQSSPSDVVVAPQEETAPADTPDSTVENLGQVVPAPVVGSPGTVGGCCGQSGSPGSPCCSPRRTRVVRCDNGCQPVRRRCRIFRRRCR